MPDVVCARCELHFRPLTRRKYCNDCRLLVEQERRDPGKVLTPFGEAVARVRAHRHTREDIELIGDELAKEIQRKARL